MGLLGSSPLPTIKLISEDKVMKSSNEIKFYAPRIFIRYTGFLKRPFKGKYFVQLEGFQVDESKMNGEVMSQRFYCNNEKEVVDAVNAIQDNVANNQAIVINLVKEFNCYNDTHVDLSSEEILSECSSSAM